MMIVIGALVVTVATAQEARDDAIWARVASGPITLDGILDEADWALAESIVIQYGQDAGIPGSGWKIESGDFTPDDPTTATLRLLVYENQMYLGVEVQDSYVGGSMEFNRFDGLLMAIKDHLDPGAPKPPAEYFYAWWYAEDEDPQPPGQDPAFIGRWAEWPPGSPRTQEQLDAWDAVTVVDGLSNDDTVLDQGYTVEMRFDLTPMGYDVTQPEGDIVEWNISIYDCDGFWPFNATVFTANRVWWQSPWGNAAWYDEVHVFARPDVTVSSGPTPPLAPEMVIPVLSTPPVIDGALDDAIWENPSVYTFDIRYGDPFLRQSYPGVGPYRAGQFQPQVNGGEAFVLDPADATVKVFSVGDILYLGFDVRDLVVQFHPDINRWDGFLVTINERDELGPDNQLLSRRLGFQVDVDGTALAQDYLLTLLAEDAAEIALQLGEGTTVDTLGTDLDNGFTAELAVDLTSFGYGAGSGRDAVFLGITLLDGDSFIPFTDSYGTRTWWFREYEDECCPVWAGLSLVPISVDPVAGDWPIPGSTYGYANSYPNPSLSPRIQFWIPERNDLTLEVFDLRGRLVARRALGAQNPGEGDISVFAGKKVGSGVYLYRLTLQDPATGLVRSTLSGKTIVVK
jgi:hypothetical protein